MSSRKQFYTIENIMKGLANHRRAEILFLLQKYPGLSTEQIVEQLDINYQTGAVHVRRMVRSGLVSAHRQGQMVSHELTPVGKKIITLLEKL